MSERTAGDEVQTEEEVHEDMRVDLLWSQDHSIYSWTLPAGSGGPVQPEPVTHGAGSDPPHLFRSRHGAAAPL